MSLTADVRRSDGTRAGTVGLPDELFGITPNVPVMHQVVMAQLQAARAGTHSTKRRSEVRGGGAKPWRQKGTGRARQGSSRAPHWTGGGSVFGPKPRSYEQRTPRKMKRLALISALSDRAGEGRVGVLELGVEEPSTRAARRLLAALDPPGRVLVVITDEDAATGLSFRNLPEAQVIVPTELSPYDILRNDWLLFTPASLAWMQGAEEITVDRTGAEEPEPEVEDDTPREQRRRRLGRRRREQPATAGPADEASDEDVDDDDDPDTPAEAFDAIDDEEEPVADTDEPVSDEPVPGVPGVDEDPAAVADKAAGGSAGWAEASEQAVESEAEGDEGDKS